MRTFPYPTIACGEVAVGEKAWLPIDLADDFDDSFDDEEGFFDCHMGPSGSCGAAGSEQCEFECPYRRDQREAKAARRKRKPMPLFEDPQL